MNYDNISIFATISTLGMPATFLFSRDNVQKDSCASEKNLGARVPRSDGKILHRQKRGWMWNQFFLLEEYTGSDYQYVGKVSLH